MDPVTIIFVIAIITIIVIAWRAFDRPGPK